MQPICVEDLARLAVDVCDREDDVEMDAVGPDVFTYAELARLLARKTGVSCSLLHLSPAMAMIGARLLGLALRDVVLSQDEMAGLTGDLLVSKSEDPPPGETRLADWLDENANRLGARYASELDRHYR